MFPHSPPERTSLPERIVSKIAEAGLEPDGVGVMSPARPTIGCVPMSLKLSIGVLRNPVQFPEMLSFCA